MPQVFLLLWLLTLQAAALEDPFQVKVRPGEDATLQCQAPTGVNITLLEWTRPELKPEGYVFFYRNRRPYENYHHKMFKGRVELRAPSVRGGDVSVIVRNVSLSDAGTYECRIITSNSSSGNRVQGEIRRSVNLTVTASGITDGGTEDGGDEDGGDEDGGDEKRPLSVILIVLAAVGALVVVVIVISAVIICRTTKKPSKPNQSYKRPAET